MQTPKRLDVALVGLSTNIHAVVDGLANPIGFDLTSHLEPLPPGQMAFDKPTGFKPQRRLCCFLLGWVSLMATLLNHIPIYVHRWNSFLGTQQDEFYAYNSF